MPLPRRITGIPSGAVDKEHREIRFDLATSDGKEIPYVAKYAVLAQVISALARMATELRLILMAEKAMEATATEDVAAAHIQKDRWKPVVLVQLITSSGVPYTFSIPCLDAADIAGRLKTESERPT